MFLRALLLPIGFIKKCISIGNEGARDIQNKLRFKNAIIDTGCAIDDHSEIAGFTHILSNSQLNNTVVKSYSYIGKNCIIQNARIGSFCSIANDVMIGLGKHPITNFSTATLFYRKHNTLNVQLIDEDLPFEEYDHITIGCDVWVGARAIIMDGVEIGHGAIVAANAVVTKNVPAYSIVGGSPARVIKYRFDEEKIDKLLKSKWWEQKLEIIKAQISDLNRL